MTSWVYSEKMANKKILILLCSLSTLLSYNLATVIKADRFLATWNLQGGFASSDEKWSINVRNLVTQPNGPSVVAVQEAGPLPYFAKRQGYLGDHLINPKNLDQEVIEYQWDIGTPYIPDVRWVYYAENDKGSNVALCTKDRADSVIILRPRGSKKLLLGIQLNTDLYFSIHASKHGCGKAVAVLETLHAYAVSNQLQGYQVIAMGDFNINPKDLRAALEQQHPEYLNNIGIYYPDAPTHKTDTVDYAVIAQDGYDLQKQLRVAVVEPQLHGILRPNHQPVTFYVVQN